VEYATKDQAQNAVNTLSNQNLMGRLIYVREVSDRASRLNDTCLHIHRIVSPSLASAAAHLVAALVACVVVSEAEWEACVEAWAVQWVEDTVADTEDQWAAPWVVQWEVEWVVAAVVVRSTFQTWVLPVTLRQEKTC